jgi:hypothetical protein
MIMTKTVTAMETLKSHKDVSFLGCFMMLTDKQLQTFQRNTSSFLGLLYPEDKGTILLGNVGYYLPLHRAKEPTRIQSS